jgi:hypothetical protein
MAGRNGSQGNSLKNPASAGFSYFEPPKTAGNLRRYERKFFAL